MIVGNGKWATVGIFAFIALLAFLFWRSAIGAEVDFSAGSSFGTEGYGPVIGMNVRQPIGESTYVFGGTDLWGSTTYTGMGIPNNWDWHGGFEACRGMVCASIGPAYVQRVDAINGAHTNYYLGLRFRVSPRLSVTLGHISDAGTSSPNVGRQFLSLSYRFQ